MSQNVTVQRGNYELRVALEMNYFRCKCSGQLQAVAAILVSTGVQGNDGQAIWTNDLGSDRGGP